MPRLRLAVALIVPSSADREVDTLRRACGDGTLGRIPAHLTLVPPVNVREDRLDEALDGLRGAGAATRPLAVSLGPAATFLPVNPVLYLDVGGDVGAVHSLRERVFVEPLARTLTWPFAPHVTLLDQGGHERIEAAVTALADVCIEVTFQRVHLLREERRPADGVRVWQPFADATFAAPAVVGRGGLELVLSVTDQPGPDAADWLERQWDDYGREQHGDSLSAEEPLTITARRTGAVVAVAEGHVRGPTAYLANFIVATEHRSEGIGSHLLASYVHHCALMGADELTLRTLAGGRAEAFYRRHGFVTVYPLPAWRHGRDFVQLRRDL